MPFQSRFAGRLRPQPVSSLERRVASQAAARAARRDVAMAASRAIASAAIPRSVGFVQARRRTGGFATRAMGGQELNNKDTSFTLNADTTGSIILVNGVAQGNTQTTRVGRKMVIRSITINFRVSSGTTTITSDFRVALVLDTQANGQALSITDVYDSVSPTSLRNLGNSERFRVLMVWEGTNSGNTGTAGQQTETSALAYKLFRMQNIAVQFNNGTDDTIGSIATNSIYLIAMGNRAAGTGASVVVGDCRIRFTD